MHNSSKPSYNGQQQHQHQQNHHKHQSSLIQTANTLFARVPILGYLCREVLLCECVSSMLSFLLVIKVKEFIPNDEERARWTGAVSPIVV
jgi:hypothetical protein